MESLLGSLAIFFFFALFAIWKIKSQKEKIFKNNNAINLKLLMAITTFIISINLIFIALTFGNLSIETEKNNPIYEIFEQYFLVEFAVIVIIAPLTEELLFRRLIYANTRKNRGIIIGYLVSISIFSVIHFDPLNIIHAFLLGSFYTFIYERTQSVLASIIAHALNNLFAISAVFFVEIVPLLFIEFNSPWRYLEFIIAILLLLWSLRHIYQITQSKSLQKSERPIDTAT